MSLTNPGDVYGHLTVLHSVPSHTKNRDTYWKCRCECGNTKVVAGGALRHGRTKSCGCQARNGRRNAHKTHGWTGTPTYFSWHHAHARCRSLRPSIYKDYGARGIAVCERWSKFENFLADMGVRPNGLTLDRIDNDKGYEPGNCRWATRTTQQGNRRNTLRFQGMTVAEWAEKLGVTKQVIHRRLRDFQSVHLPSREGKVHHRAQLYDGKTLREWSVELGVPINTLKARLKSRGSVLLGPKKVRKDARYVYEGRSAASWAEELGLTAEAVAYRIREHGTVHIAATRRPR